MLPKVKISYSSILLLIILTSLIGLSCCNPSHPDSFRNLADTELSNQTQTNSTSDSSNNNDTLIPITGAENLTDTNNTENSKKDF